MQTTAAKPILICSPDRASCKQLVSFGNDLAKAQQRPLTLLSVQPQKLVSPDIAKDIQTMYNIASRVGAEITVLFSNTPLLTLAVHAKQIDAAEVILDESDVTNTVFINALRELIPEIPLSVLQKDGVCITLPPRVALKSEMRTAP